MKQNAALEGQLRDRARITVAIRLTVEQYEALLRAAKRWGSQAKAIELGLKGLEELDATAYPGESR